MQYIRVFDSFAKMLLTSVIYVLTIIIS